MTSATTGSRTVLLVGGFAPGQSQWSIQQGFEAAGYRVVYVPSRGCIAANSEADAALAKEEADLIPPPEQWDLCYPNNAAYEEGLAKLIEQHQPELLLWWFSKDDCPAGLITNLRNRFGWLKTATHTQDDPWDALRHPEFSQEFEFVVTCCKESVSVYRDRGLRAIVLYPPPARQLHATATPAPHETCDFSVTILSIYAQINACYVTKWSPPSLLWDALMFMVDSASAPLRASLGPVIAAFEPMQNSPGSIRRRRSISISTILLSLTVT